MNDSMSQLEQEAPEVDRDGRNQFREHRTTVSFLGIKHVRIDW